MRKYFLYMLLFIVCAGCRRYTLCSPDNTQTLTVSTSPLAYTLSYKGEVVMADVRPAMTLNTAVWGEEKPVGIEQCEPHRDYARPLYGKQDSLRDDYNQLIVHYPSYDVVFRLYNEGFAYRFVGTGAHSDTLTVVAEQAPFPLKNDPKVFFGDTITYTSWELGNKVYDHVSLIPEGRYGQTPMPFVDRVAGRSVVVAESDLHGYPGMFLRKENNVLTGHWAYEPDSVALGSWGFVLVAQTRKPWLAQVPADHAFPWRIVIVTDDDRTLLTNEMVWLLAEPCALEDMDWIKPGKAAWEWWHCAKPSTALYKQYIDFAAENGLEYLLVDAGWNDLFHPLNLRPHTDIHEVIRYGKERGVGVFVWLAACTFIWDRVSDTPNHYLDSIAAWGAAGVKIDFFDRDDASMQWEYEYLAMECAKRHLLVDFHGCSKPTGLSRKYPNILNYEAVRGEECCKWDTTSSPDYRAQFLFSRQLAGPMDYTPGSMQNCNPDVFRPRDPGLPSTLGTRSQELALYILLDQYLAMLCDSPEAYRADPDVLRFLGQVPVTWNETHALSARMGDHAVVAKRHGGQWYVGGMCAWTPRELTVDFSFLKPGMTYTAECFYDHPGCSEDARLYRHETIEINSDMQRTFSLAAGGGFAIVINPIITNL